jgi:hypothetical protein
MPTLLGGHAIFRHRPIIPPLKTPLTLMLHCSRCARNPWASLNAVQDVRKTIQKQSCSNLPSRYYEVSYTALRDGLHGEE